MAKFVLLFAAAACFCQGVFSMSIDFDNVLLFENDNVKGPQQQPQQPPVTPGSTTTTASPEFTNCVANCPVLAQYNPVCGTDGQSYSNVYRLRCAQDCGQSVEVSYVGTCGPAGRK